MATLKTGILRLGAAGIVCAGAAALPLQTASAQPEGGGDPCAEASPSKLDCGTTTTTATTTTTTAAPATTTTVKGPQVDSESVDREPTAVVLNSGASRGGANRSSGSELAVTGGDAAGLAALGGAAIAVGGTMIVVRRRRRDS